MNPIDSSVTPGVMIDTLLIANRGEIACRILRTAKAMGLRTVAVHSSIDRNARHVREADMAVDLGGSTPADSYLCIEKILQAARQCGAQAVHPGYGFLSENANFARALEATGLVFIGPPASAIAAMGSKSAAKALMAAAGVPLVPGYHGAAQDLETFRRAAALMGYPVLLKASAGGGGKGMKVVESEADLDAALSSAQREAQGAFADAHILLEKYLLAPRHIEIQVFADRHGHCLYLNERDCSIQRRHQKVLEEAPAPHLPPSVRAAMGQAAVRAATAIDYVGAGTVEFLLDARGEFFFMEMNTRLQVEHPITEAVTGLDLVEWQLRVARGEALPLTQGQVPLRGHAIEVRLYAEDPDAGFLPASGHLAVYREALPGPGRRVDSGVQEGDDVSPFYDPLLAKIIAWGDSREQARLRLLAMLEETAVGGFKSNLAFLKRLLGHPAFIDGAVDTGFIPRHQALLLPPAVPLTAEFWQAAGAAYFATEPRLGEVDDPWSTLVGLRVAGAPRVALGLQCAGQSMQVVLASSWAEPSPTEFMASLTPVGAGSAREASRPNTSPKQTWRVGNTLYLQWQGEFYSVEPLDPIAEATASHRQIDTGLAAPMNGSIVGVLVEVGQQVTAGTPLVVLEAMKMEHSLRANRAGIVRAILCHKGELVAEGTELIELEEER